jgi:hypothetical protein
LGGPKALKIAPGAPHLFPEPGALEAVIDYAGQWFTQYLAPAAQNGSLAGGRSPAGGRHGI